MVNYSCCELHVHVGCSQLYPQDQSRMEVSYIVCVKAWRQRSIVRVGVMLELTQVQLKHYLASISQHSTNQIVQKFDIRN